MQFPIANLFSFPFSRLFLSLAKILEGYSLVALLYDPYGRFT